MKMKWLATAIITACVWGAAAHASESLVMQDTATIYGRVDGGVGYVNYRYTAPDLPIYKNFELGTAGHAWQLQSGESQSNLFGFKGSMPLFEDLLGVFKFEGTFNNITLHYNGGMFGLNAYAGVVSPNWGTLLTGWQKSVSDDFFNAPFSNFGFNQLPQANLPGAGGDVFGNAAGWPGAGIKYLSPLYNGFHYGASLAYGLKFQTKKHDTDAKLYPQGNFLHASLALGYDQGPWKAAATYDLYQPLGVVREKGKPALWEQSYTLSLNYERNWGRTYLSFAQAFAPSAHSFGLYAHVGSNLASSATAPLRTHPHFSNSTAPGGTIEISKNYVNTAVAVGTVLNFGPQQIYLGYSFGYSKADVTSIAQTDFDKNKQNAGSAGKKPGDITDSSKKNEHVDNGDINDSSNSSSNSGSGTSMRRASLYATQLMDASTTAAPAPAADKDALSANEKSDPINGQPQQFRALTNLFQVGYVFNLSDETSVYVYGGYGIVKYQRKYDFNSCSARKVLCDYIQTYRDKYHIKGWETTTRLTLKQFGIGITQSF